MSPHVLTPATRETMIPSMHHQPSNSTAMGDVPSLSPPPPPPPPPPSLPRRHVKRCSPSQEETDEEEKKPKKYSRKLPQRPPTDRVLRSRSKDSRHEEEEEEEEEVEVEEKAAELRISLSQKEIEEDFVKLTGSKPPRRPKQRCKTRAQIRLKRLFPGLGLPRTITSDAYIVKETD